MTRKEFEDRTGRKISVADYAKAETLYMASGNMDKDEFCTEIRKMCAYDGATDEIEIRPILVEIADTLALLQAKVHFLEGEKSEKSIELAEFLIGKAHAHDDTDFRMEAVKLVGECDVVLMTLQMGLPLWDEDKRYIIENLGQGIKD